MSGRRPVRSDLTSRAETRGLDYLVVEGPPGSGKTELAARLARHLRGRLVLDRAVENPFLAEFYHSPRRSALKTQLFFTLSRYMQQQEIAQQDLFHDLVVSDYLFVKDRIYASTTLDDRELALYERLVGLIQPALPRPDLVIYLQSDTDRLMERVRAEGRPFERRMEREYLVAVLEAYNYYFLHYEEAPLLVVNTRTADPAREDAAFEDLVAELGRPQSGLRWFSPMDREPDASPE